jgi:hypothetical protein
MGCIFIPSGLGFLYKSYQILVQFFRSALLDKEIVENIFSFSIQNKEVFD